MSRTVAAMVSLQRLTGARPAEICNLKIGEIDRSGEIWIANLARHKCAHHGHQRQLFLGPRAKAIVEPFLDRLDPGAYVFSAIEAEREYRDIRYAKRITPMSCGNRPGSNRVKAPRRQTGECYSEDAYRRAIHRACDRADAWQKAGRIIGNNERIIERWSPHRLRHTAGTELRRRFGVEAARCILGHRNLSVTEVYAERNTEAAMLIMRKIG